MLKWERRLSGKTSDATIEESEVYLTGNEELLRTLAEGCDGQELSFRGYIPSGGQE